MIRHARWLLVWLALLTGCGEGGRSAPTIGARDGSHDAAGAGNPFYETGLGFRVDTILAQGANRVVRQAYGVDGLPLALDVDGDPHTGNALGADVVVHFFSALLAAELRVEPLDGAPFPLPLQLEVTVVDPRNFLGLPGMAGQIDPDLRVALGFDARQGGAPGRFRQRLTALDSTATYLFRFTRAELQTEITEPAGPVSATLALMAERDGQRADGLELAVGTQPVTGSRLSVVFGPDVVANEMSLSLTDPADVVASLRSYEGREQSPVAQRRLSLDLSTVESELSVRLTQASVSSEPGDSHYQLNASAPIERARAQFQDFAAGQYRAVRLALNKLPEQLSLVRGGEGEINIEASQPIGDLSFALADRPEIVWSAGMDPDSEFSAHRIIRRRDGDADELQIRLAGLQSLAGQFGDLVRIDASLSAAPLLWHEQNGDDYIEASLDRLPGSFALSLPSDGDDLDLFYQADARGPGLTYRARDGDRTTTASLRPLPKSLSLCSSSDGRCGSHARGTDVSLVFEASEAVTLNFDRRRDDGRTRTLIQDLALTRLAMDAGTRSGGRRGYVYFDTDGLPFSGRYRKVSGDDGLDLMFSPGTQAQERLVAYKDFVRVHHRSGEMQCPGRRDLDIRVRGRWIDAGFILDELCE